MKVRSSHRGELLCNHIWPIGTNLRLLLTNSSKLELTLVLNPLAKKLFLMEIKNEMTKIFSLSLFRVTTSNSKVLFHFRKSHDMRTFVNAVIICVAVLDILDVLRVLPVLVESVFGEEIFRHVYCTMGIFHEFAVALFIVAINIAVCVQVPVWRHTSDVTLVTSY